MTRIGILTRITLLDFKKNNKIPSQVESFLTATDSCIPNFSFFNSEDQVFKLPSWYAVAAGNEQFPIEKVKQIFEIYEQGISKEAYQYVKDKYLAEIKEIMPLLVDHHEFLQYLKQ